MIIRKAKIEDINGIAVIMFQVSQIHYDNRSDIFKMKNEEEIREEIKEMILNKEKDLLIVEKHSKIVGVLIYRIKHIKKHMNIKDSKIIWIEELGVSEEYRRQGIGRILMKELKKIAKKANCQRIELNCWEFNKNAIEFYENQGMKAQRRIMEIDLDEQ